MNWRTMNSFRFLLRKKVDGKTFSFTDHLNLADESGIPYQIEVESAGGSDGNQLQKSSFPFDWCFVGAPEDHVHSPDEKVHKKDIEAMVQLYTYLMKHL